jgi:hypothetical protein
MKRIIFVLGLLGIMGLASSFTKEDQLQSEPTPGCDGGSRVCCVNGQVNFG